MAGLSVAATAVRIEVFSFFGVSEAVTMNGPLALPTAAAPFFWGACCTQCQADVDGTVPVL